jgi:predicted RNase H-like HicB family nuclease
MAYLSHSETQMAGEDLILIRWTAGRFVATTEDFPGCTGEGPNAMDAVRSLREAIVKQLEIEQPV